MILIRSFCSFCFFIQAPLLLACIPVPRIGILLLSVVVPGAAASGLRHPGFSPPRKTAPPFHPALLNLYSAVCSSGFSAVWWPRGSVLPGLWQIPSGAGNPVPAVLFIYLVISDFIFLLQASTKFRKCSSSAAGLFLSIGHPS